MRRIRLLALLSLPAAFAPAAASAESRVVARAPLVAGPELAGASVVWGERFRGGGLVVRSGAPGRRPADLFTFAAPQQGTQLSLDGLAASASHLAMVRSAFRPFGRSAESFAAPVRALGGVSTTLVAGPLGGPFVKVSGSRGLAVSKDCRPAVVPSEPALSGATLVFFETVITCPRTGERLFERIVVVDLARPGSRRVVAEGSEYFFGGEPRVALRAPRVAGDRVAWQVERQTRRGGMGEVWTVDLGARGSRARRVRTVADGDVLEWFAAGADGSLAVSSADDGGLHRLALRRRGGRTSTLPQILPSGSGGYEPRTSAVGLARGRLAFVDQDGRLLVTDGAGRGPAVARFSQDRDLVGDFAFDGRHVAWAEQAGGRPAIRLARTP